MCGYKRMWKIRKDESGSIEGLPLQLMIMGIIASLGTAIIVGWISSIETPVYIGRVEIDPVDIIVTDGDRDGTFESSLQTFRIRVMDTGGNPIEDVRVLLEGQSIDNARHRLYGTTDVYGFVEFEDVGFKVVGERPGEVSISVSGQNIANEFWTEILVLPE